MTHLADATLALYAGKELDWLTRLRISLHLRGCERCRRHARELRQVREWMHGQGQEMPAGVRWDALAAEMTANVRLGLAAGRCVSLHPTEDDSAPAAPRFLWRNPALALPLLVLVVAGWFLQSWRPPLQPRPEFVLQAGVAGIGVEKDGRGLSLLNPETEDVVYSVRGSAAGARYVDAESGQVTVSYVYAQ